MSLTLDNLTRMYGERAVVEHFTSRHPPDYQTFVEIVNAALDTAIGEAQRAAQYLFEQDEDSITTFLVASLRGQGLDAEHDSDVGGHVDVYVKDLDRRFSWGAEAKIDLSWPWVESGVPQLMDRYADGTTGRDQGALLIYMKQDQAATRMAHWRALVQAKYESKPDFAISNCTTRHPYAFFSECIYSRTAQPFRIRHVAVVLFRKASRDALDKRITAVDDDRRRQAQLQADVDETSAELESLATTLEALASSRPGDSQVEAAALLARRTASKAAGAARLAAGDMTGVRARVRRKKAG